jgi:tetratricopeptide (TPR) repeat protein
MKSHFHRFTASVLCTAILSWTAVAVAQSADPTAEISRLLNAGQIDQAANVVESALASKPRDPQLRFVRGVIQIEQKKISDAIVTFSKMTEDFPELPEPYNNLAVLYAGQGQYEKARAALELAIRTHPSYSTAHENLGDVYSKMAGESYSKALQLDTANNAVQMKLNLIKSLNAAKPGAPVAAPPPAPVAVVAKPVPAPIPAPPVVVVAPPPVVIAPPPMAQAPAPVLTPPPVVVSAESAKQIQPKPVARIDDNEAVYAAVQNWAKAWARQDVDAYLASYGKAFAVPGGDSRKAWEKERRARIEGKSSIQVTVESPQVLVEGNTATVKFRQQYQADSLSANSRKTLKLSKAEGAWKIIEETVGK